MTNKIIIKLKKEDLLWGITHIPIVGVNEMYMTKGRKRCLSPKARKYKKFLESCAPEIAKTFKIPDSKRLYIYAKFYIHSPLTKSGKLDQRTIRDVDNLFKPIQDSYQGLPGFWKDDKMIRGVSGIIEENKYDYTRIELYLYDYDIIAPKIDKVFLDNLIT